MKILELKDNKIILSPEALGLTFFKALWSRDKSKDKTQAYKDISYVFYFTDFNSPFYSYSADQRDGLIKQYVVEDKDFKVDKEINEAIKCYGELNITPAMRMLSAAFIAIDKMEDYFKDVDYAEDDIDKVQKCIIAMPKLVTALNEANELCRKETTGTTKVRGNATVGMFEDKQ